MSVAYAQWPDRDERVGYTGRGTVSTAPDRLWYVQPSESDLTIWGGYRFGTEDLRTLSKTHVDGVWLGGFGRLTDAVELQRFIAAQPALRFVNISGVGGLGPAVDNEVMATIARCCPELEMLMARGTGKIRLRPTDSSRYDDEGVGALGSLRHLRVLVITSQRSVSGKFVVGGGFRALEAFAAEETSVDDLACRGIAKLPRLRHLDVRRSRVTGVGVAELATCRTLRVLRIDAKALRPQDMEWMAHSALEYIEIVDVEGDPQWMVEIVGRIPGLKEARVVPTENSKDAGRVVRRLKELERAREGVTVSVEERWQWGG